MKGYKVLGIVAGVLMIVHVVFYLVLGAGSLVNLLFHFDFNGYMQLIRLGTCVFYAVLCFAVIGRVNILFPALSTVFWLMPLLGQLRYISFGNPVGFTYMSYINPFLAMFFFWLLVVVPKGKKVFLIFELFFRGVQLYSSMQYVWRKAQWGFYWHLIPETNGIWMFLCLMFSAIAVYLSCLHMQQPMVQQGYAARTPATYQDMNVVSRFCTNCGKPIVGGATFCGSCGHRIHL